MKKITALILALALALSLAACNGKTTKRASSGSDLTKKQIEELTKESK